MVTLSSPTGNTRLNLVPPAERQPEPAIDAVMRKELGIPGVRASFRILRSKASAPRRVARFVYGARAVGKTGRSFHKLPDDLEASGFTAILNSDYQDRLAPAPP